MAKGKHNNLTNRNQDHSASSEPNTPNTAIFGYFNTPENQDSDLKTYLMMLVEIFKIDINNSLKEIQENMDKQVEGLNEEAQNSLKELQENTAKQVEVLKEETQKSLKELQENTTKQVMMLNKTIQDLKNGSRNNEENPKGDNSGYRNPRKEIRNHRSEHQQQNTKDGRENLRCRRFHKEHGNNN
jgi:DNA anti-recombination protein RmuC